MNREKIHERSKAMYGKYKGFMAEFSTFIMRGNVMDMAVGVIVGAAFQKIISSLVDDIISPVIGLLVRVNFSDLAVSVFGVDLKYGSFIMAVINFVIVAFALFVLVKALNTARNLGKKPEAEEATTKECQYCKSEISIEATRCPHCTSILSEEKAAADDKTEAVKA